MSTTRAPIHAVNGATVHAGNFEIFLKHVGFTATDAAVLEGLASWAEAHADEVVREFYDRQFSNLEFKRAVAEAGTTRERLSGAQKRYFLDWFKGRPDAAYVTGRQFIGTLHAQVDIKPMWFITAYQMYYDILNPLLRRHYALRRGAFDRAMSAITKLITFDQAVIMDAHTAKLMHDLESTLATVSVTSQDVSRAVTDFAAGAQGQAASVQAAMGALNEVSQSVDAVAVSASDAAAFSDQSNQAAQKGATIIHEMIGSMESIDATTNDLEDQVRGLQSASNEIGRVIDTIDSIAQETNLLALNAAIEAARAAERGRGFAVVAEEVRSLAVTTQSETKLIGETIHQLARIVDEVSRTIARSSADAGRGRQLADRVRESLSEIVDAVSQSAGESQQIAALSQEISAALRQVVNEVESISSVAEESSAASEELAAAAQELVDAADKRNQDRLHLLASRGMRQLAS